MDATTAQPTLLNAARNFIRKSAGTAVIAIAPLAAVALAPEAKAQVVFETPGSMQVSGFGRTGDIYNASFESGGYFSSQLPNQNGIAGFNQGVNALFNISGSSGGTGYVNMPAVGFTGTIAADTNIPVSYSFTFSGTGTTSVDSWTLYLRVSPDSLQQLASGSGFGTFSDTVTYTQMFDADGGLGDNASFQLAFDLSGGGDVHLLMNSATQGFSFNALTAVPEPSAYAAIFGLGAFGFAGLRRLRRRAA